MKKILIASFCLTVLMQTASQANERPAAQKPGCVADIIYHYTNMGMTTSGDSSIDMTLTGDFNVELKDRSCDSVDYYSLAASTPTPSPKRKDAIDPLTPIPKFTSFDKLNSLENYIKPKRP